MFYFVKKIPVQNSSTPQTHSGGSSSYASSSQPSSTGSTSPSLTTTPTTDDQADVAPPISTRPEKTKSIYTKPREIENEHRSITQEEPKVVSPITFAPTNEINGTLEKTKNHPTPQGRGRKVPDSEILEKLKTIVSVGDPTRKYNKMEKIGQG